jgi:hypothetical protein
MLRILTAGLMLAALPWLLALLTGLLPAALLLLARLTRTRVALLLLLLLIPIGILVRHIGISWEQFDASPSQGG